MRARATDHLILGGGLTGLGRAWRLAAAGHEVVLLEAAARLGGTLRTVAEGGYRVDDGATAVVGPAPHLEALLQAVPNAPALSAEIPLWPWRRRGLEAVRPPVRPVALLRRLGRPLRRVPSPALPGAVRLIVGGVGGLPAALGAALEDRAVTGARVTSLTHDPASGCWDALADDGRTWRAREIALALPAAEQARLLAPFAPHHAEVLAAIPHQDVVQIAVGLRTPAPRSVAAFVRLGGAPGRLGGAVVTSRIEPERAPPDRWLVQTSLTDADAPGVLSWSEEALEAVVVADLGRAFGVPIRLDALRLVCSERARAVPHRGHRARMARMQASLGDRGLLLLGDHVLGDHVLGDCVPRDHVLGDHVLGSGLDRRSVPAAPTRGPVPEGVAIA